MINNQVMSVQRCRQAASCPGGAAAGLFAGLMALVAEERAAIGNCREEELQGIGDRFQAMLEELERLRPVLKGLPAEERKAALQDLGAVLRERDANRALLEVTACAIGDSVRNYSAGRRAVRTYHQPGAATELLLKKKC